MYAEVCLSTLRLASEFGFSYQVGHSGPHDEFNGVSLGELILFLILRVGGLCPRACPLNHSPHQNILRGLDCLTVPATTLSPGSPPGVHADCG